MKGTLNLADAFPANDDRRGGSLTISVWKQDLGFLPFQTFSSKLTPTCVAPTIWPSKTSESRGESRSDSRKTSKMPNRSLRSYFNTSGRWSLVRVLGAFGPISWSCHVAAENVGTSVVNEWRYDCLLACLLAGQTNVRRTAIN